MMALLALAILSPVGLEAWPEPQEARTMASSQDYEIGADDILKITVYGHDDLTHTVIIQPDGTFTFPLIGRVKAADLTPKELEQKLTILLAQGFIRNPQVTVVVQEYRSKTVYVVGEVARPGIYPLSESRNVVEVLSRAGPLTSNAGAEVIIVRPSTPVKGPVLPPEAPGGAQGTSAPVKAPADVIRVNIRDIQAGDLTKNVALRPNDTVFVPEAPRVFVSGEVRNPGSYPFAPGTTVRQAISLAGGFTENASTGRLRVVRRMDNKAKQVKVQLDDPVQPGDTVVVKEKLF